MSVLPLEELVRHVSLPLCALLSGCVTATVNELSENLEFEPGIDDVLVGVPSGDLTVVVGSVSVPELYRTIRWTGEEPYVAAFVDGSVLHVDVDCRSFQLTCQVDHLLRLPLPASLTAELDSGSILASGLADRVEVHTGNGDLDLSSMAGDIVASTGKGRIALEDLTGSLSVDSGTGDVVVLDSSLSELLATSGSGTVDLALRTQPDRVVVDSGSGKVSVSVPRGIYRIEAQTGSGEVSITGLTADDGADAVIDVETGRGDIAIQGI